MTRYFDVTHSSYAPPLETLREIASRAAAAQADWLLVGAAARDVVVHHALSQNPTRATRDLDIAIAVNAPKEFCSFMKDWQPPGHTQHRITIAGAPVDVVPCGRQDNRSDTVMIDDNHQLDVVGLAEALEQPDLCTIGDFKFKVASLEALASLKVLAWRDRRHINSKDAVDLNTILEAAGQGIYADETWDDEEALASQDYAIHLAGAYRLGRNSASVLGQRARHVADVLHRDADLLSRQMKGMEAAELLKAFTLGYIA